VFERPLQTVESKKLQTGRTLGAKFRTILTKSENRILRILTSDIKSVSPSHGQNDSLLHDNWNKQDGTTPETSSHTCQIEKSLIFRGIVSRERFGHFLRERCSLQCNIEGQEGACCSKNQGRGTDPWFIYKAKNEERAKGVRGLLSCEDEPDSADIQKKDSRSMPGSLRKAGVGDPKTAKLERTGWRKKAMKEKPRGTGGVSIGE